MYVREDHVLFIQWLDKRAASLLSTRDHATDHDDAQSYVREEGEWQVKGISRLASVATYNRYMGGIDTSDHLAEGNSILRRSKKSWKVTMYGLHEVSVINADDRK